MYIKTVLHIAKNETPKDKKVKEQALAETANKWTDSSFANCSEQNHYILGRRRPKQIPKTRRH